MFSDSRLQTYDSKLLNLWKQLRKNYKQNLKNSKMELHFNLPKEIQKAREFGDLRENAEYKAALERQTLVSARMVQLCSG